MPAHATAIAKRPARPAAGPIAPLLTAARRQKADPAILKWLARLSNGDTRPKVAKRAAPQNANTLGGYQG